MRYDKHFKEQAVQLSHEIGIKKASQQLGIPYHTLFGWSQDMKVHGENAFPGSGHKQLTGTHAEQIIAQLRKDNEEQQKTIEILREALNFFVKSRKK